jgi:hypothetical protein
MSTTPPPLAADLTAGLRRLKLAAMRRLAPELLVTAKTQRWNPDEFLRTLIEAEISSRDESNARTRMRQASFPVTKTLAEFDVTASSIPQAFDYLASQEWIRGKENACFIRSDCRRLRNRPGRQLVSVGVQRRDASEFKTDRRHGARRVSLGEHLRPRERGS